MTAAVNAWSRWAPRRGQGAGPRFGKQTADPGVGHTPRISKSRAAPPVLSAVGAEVPQLRTRRTTVSPISSTSRHKTMVRLRPRVVSGDVTALWCYYQVHVQVQVHMHVEPAP
jgi:hypothetical protein